jgi:hypothetical protein
LWAIDVFFRVEALGSVASPADGEIASSFAAWHGSLRRARPGVTFEVAEEHADAWVVIYTPSAHFDVHEPVKGKFAALVVRPSLGVLCGDKEVDGRAHADAIVAMCRTLSLAP